jgi:hypothetical protein
MTSARRAVQHAPADAVVDAHMGTPPRGCKGCVSLDVTTRSLGSNGPCRCSHGGLLGSRVERGHVRDPSQDHMITRGLSVRQHLQPGPQHNPGWYENLRMHLDATVAPDWQPFDETNPDERDQHPCRREPILLLGLFWGWMCCPGR